MLLSIGGGRRARLEFFRTLRLPVALARTVIGRLAEMRHAMEGRRAIARMDTRMLSDIGLSHGEAIAEASRRPWDTARRKF